MFKKERLAMFLVLVLLLCCSVILSLSKEALAFTLPDTGQTKCYGIAGTGQDGAYSINPMSYTDNGNGTITDNVTGLMWQKGENSYSIYGWEEALSICGSLTLGGQTDWRLPTKKELITLVDYSIPSPGPTINTTYFPNTYYLYDPPGYLLVPGYWSSTTYADNTGYVLYNAWYVSFNYGRANSGSYRRYYGYVRCVRGGQSSPSFTDNGNRTVTDNVTGLMWQQGAEEAKIWADALSYCEGLSLGAQSDWRLPNIKELESITDNTKINPAIDKTYFPNTYAYSYWSSTTLAGGTDTAWIVAFSDGIIYSNYSKSDGVYYVQCVRGGQSGSSAQEYTLTATKTGNGTITSSPSGINCGSTCSASFAAGTSVTLTAAPDSGYTFTGWSGGGCSGSGTCTVTVNSDVAVTATFTVIPAATNNCAASLTTELSLHIPILTYSGSSYWADFLNVPNTLNFTLTNANTVSDTSPYSGCTPASLSSDSKLHVPVIMFNGASYWADFLYTGGMNFSFVNAGGN